MNRSNEVYIDLKDLEWDLSLLDDEERHLVALLRKRVRTHPDWNDFDAYWVAKVSALYDGRGLPRKVSKRTAVYQIGQDLSSRLAISLGFVKEPDYRDELREIIRTRFRSQRDFCKATGLTEDMLSHVLAGRKDLSVEALTNALGQIGYSLQMVPKRPGKSKSA